MQSSACVSFAGLSWACDQAPLAMGDDGDVAHVDEVSSLDALTEDDAAVWTCTDPRASCDVLPPPASDSGGRALRQGDDFPERLSGLGCFSPGDPFAPAAGVIA